MLNMLEKTIENNLLKYAAGRQIFCPKCDNILDYRSTVVAETPSGQTHILCVSCFHDGLQKVHSDEPIKYLRDIGWNITMPDIKKKRETKWSTEFSVVDSNGGKHVFPADLAFSMYGNKFYVHPRMGINGEKVKGKFTVSCQNGAAVAYGNNKASTIREAKAKLESVGERGFFDALSRCKG